MARYQHDCDECIALGTHEDYDLYVCPDEPTVIARRSSEGSDYISGIVFADSVAPLGVALARAQERGLLR